MTDNWARYLRLRNKWMRGSGGAKKAKGGGGGGADASGWGDAVGQWWDERVVSANKQWVAFQIQSAKGSQRPTKQAASKQGAGKAASKAARVEAPRKRGSRAVPSEVNDARRESSKAGASDARTTGGDAAGQVAPAAVATEHVHSSTNPWTRLWAGRLRSPRDASHHADATAPSSVGAAAEASVVVDSKRAAAAGPSVISEHGEVEEESAAPKVPTRRWWQWKAVDGSEHSTAESQLEHSTADPQLEHSTAEPRAHDA